MSCSFNCHCAERRKPVEERDWVVIARNSNSSAFNGYRRTHSAYSELWCNRCGALGRTKAAFVPFIKGGMIDHSRRGKVDAPRSTGFKLNLHAKPKPVDPDAEREESDHRQDAGEIPNC